MNAHCGSEREIDPCPTPSPVHPRKRTAAAASGTSDGRPARILMRSRRLIGSPTQYGVIVAQKEVASQVCFGSQSAMTVGVCYMRFSPNAVLAINLRRCADPTALGLSR
jgi:hypothetical protein